MKNRVYKLIKRIIAKLYKLTNNHILQLFLMNITTKLFFCRGNSIEFDKKHNFYWLKNEKQYLFAVDKPYMNFDRCEMDQKFMSIFCYKYTPKQGDVILNIGAGIGSELTLLNRLVSDKGKIFNIEASLNCFKKIDALCRINNFRNNNNFNLAITNFEGDLWIEDEENYRINKTNRKAQGNKVKATTVDSFILVNRIKKIDFLKVNIEGAEFEMVDGMKNAIHIIDNIAISCHDFLNARDECITLKIKNFLTSNGFEVYQRTTGDQVLDSWIYGTK
ncbi:MAG: FkbM family methyltransferase [Flavobacteriaceae bacterium]|nr:FkbM family methyltransferase [Flavobacteriaceae bacterium]